MTKNKFIAQHFGNLFDDKNKFESDLNKVIKSESQLIHKDLKYWMNNASPAYVHTPLCVLRYISKLEKALNLETN